MTTTKTTPADLALAALYEIAKIESTTKSQAIRESVGMVRHSVQALLEAAGGERPLVLMVRDSAGQVTGLRCPRCLALHGQDGDEEGDEIIQEVDTAERWNWMGTDAEGGRFLASWSDGPEWEHAGFRCDSCSAKLTGPAELEIDGS